MRVDSLCQSILLLSVLFLPILCNADDKTFQVVGTGQCADCQDNHFKPSHAFSGLHVTIDCKLKNGSMNRVAAGDLDDQGDFKLSIPRDIVHQDGKKLKHDCYAQLHNAAAVPCAAHSGLEASKIVFKSADKDGKHILFSPSKNLEFSAALCTSKFLWPHFKYPPLPKTHPWLKNFGHPWILPPLSPIYKHPFIKPLPPPVPIYKPPIVQPLPPPVPVYKPPIVKPLPPPVPVYKPPVVKPLPPPVPVYKPPKKPCPPTKPKPPVYKPPVYKPPVYKPPVKPPVYKPPVYKPPVYKPPVYKPPVYKPPVYKPPVYKPPVYKPPVYKPPVVKPLPPPVPIYKPPIVKPLPPPFPFYKPPFFKKPCPPLPQLPPLPKLPPFNIPPKYFNHPKFGHFPPLPPSISHP